MTSRLAALAIAAAVISLACGPSSNRERPAVQSCEPTTCEALGATCGAVADGCSGLLQCGDCTGGDTCGGGGTPNVCGKAVACQATTCAAAGASCGSIPDGCGGTIKCGDCSGGQTCGGGGTANVCGAPPCTPTTCTAQGKTCGTISDACGGELECGDCKEGEACGAGGTANVCAPLPPTGDVAWAVAVSTVGPDYPLEAGVDDAGHRYLFTLTLNEVSSLHTLRLTKLDGAGKALLTKEWPARGITPWGSARSFHAAVTSAGNVVLTVSPNCAAGCAEVLEVDFGGGKVARATLVQLATDGSLDWQRDLGDTLVTSLSSNAQGLVAASLQGASSGATELHVYARDGSPRWSNDGFADALALDDAGNLFAAASSGLAKYGPGGALLWSRELPGAGYPLGADTTAEGTVVIQAVRVADLTYGSSEIRSGSAVLYVAEGDGTPRFARGLSYGGALAVDPTGRAAVVQQGNCGEVVVEAFDLSNADLWRKVVPDDGACSSASPVAASYGADHQLLVALYQTATMTVGGVQLVPRGIDAVGVLLKP